MNPMFRTPLAATLVMTALVATWADAAQEPDVKQEIQAIADALKKGDKATADTLAAKFMATKEIEFPLWEAMLTMKPRESKQKGFGVGKKGEFPEDLDGIEAKIRAMGKDSISPAKLKQEKAALLEMGWRLSAIALVARLEKVKNKQEIWNKNAREMIDVSQDFIKALESNEVLKVNQAAVNMNKNCNDCHR